MIIRNQVDAYDLALEKAEKEKIEAADFAGPGGELTEQEKAPVGFVRVVFGSKRPNMTLASLEERSAADLAFQSIRTKINRALTRVLGTNTQRISVSTEQEVSHILVLECRKEF